MLIIIIIEYDESLRKLCQLELIPTTLVIRYTE